MISLKFFVFFAVLAISSSIRAAMTFAEDFNSNSRGTNLVVTGGSEATIVYTGGAAKFTGVDPTGSTRAYLGTALTFDLAVAFTAEIDVSVPTGSGGNGIAFFGFGIGERGDSSLSGGGPSYYEPSKSPSAYIALIPSDFDNDGTVRNSRIASNYDNTLDVFISDSTSLVIPGSGPVGSGNHKLQMAYDSGSKSLLFSYKKQGSTGPNDLWVIATSIDISDNVFTSANGKFFFGGSGDVTFDNLSVVVVPEPSAMSLLAVLSCGALFRRRR